MPHPPMSDTTTRGVRVGATAFYLPDESEPDQGEYVFGYRVVILNTGDEAVTLLERRWVIIDGDGGRREVTGPGVVGQTPRLVPGQAFKYSSLTAVPTEWGTMDGVYRMRTDGGETFDAVVGRFWLTRESAEHPAPAE